jgi:hypothetical protein
MGHNVHDIEQPPSPRLWVTLHSWEPGVPAPFPTEENQLGEQVSITVGGSAALPVEQGGLVFSALWDGGALLWRSEVQLLKAGDTMTVNLPGLATEL